MIGQAERIIELQDRISAAHGGSAVNHNIVTFTSGKGGTGKSFACLNIASALAEKGKRVLVCDFDWNFSNLHILINQQPRYTIGDYFRNQARAEEIIFHYSKKLHFIFGDSGLLELPETDPAELKFFFNRLHSIGLEYDIILIDTGSGADPAILELFRQSAAVAIITNTEPAAVMDAYAIFKLMHRINCTAEKFLFINKAATETEGIEAYKNLKRAIQHFLKEPVTFLGVLNDSPAAASSAKKQEIFYTQNSSATETAQINAAAVKLMRSMEKADSENKRQCL